MRGGARVGAGRPKGSKNEAPKLELASPEGEMPLGYLLRIMRDTSVDPKRRDAMAKAALPYFHGRLTSVNQCPDDPNSTGEKSIFDGLFLDR